MATGSFVDFQASPARRHETDNPQLGRDFDLNGDGVADLFLVSLRGNTVTHRPLLIALSGKTGRRLWQSEVNAQVLTAVTWLDCRDLDDDGNPEIVLAAAFDHGTPHRQSFGSEDARLWLVVASGQSGKTQWAHPLAFDTKSSSARSYRYEDVSLEASYADLDGDGVLDIVLPGQRSPHDLALEMRGISGKTGQTLWRSPLPIDADATESLANAPPATIGDIDGDDRPEVVVIALVESRTNDGQIENHVQLELLDGRSGQARWNWKTPADRWGNQNASRRGRPKDPLRAVLIRHVSSSHQIAVRLWNKNHELHVIDQLGKPVSQRKDVAPFGRHQNQIWAVDSDGDGNDELIMVSQSDLMLLDPDRLETPLWKLPAKENDMDGVARILGVVEGFPTDPVGAEPAESIAAPLVILQTVADRQSVQGIDAKTGRFVWTCVGPSPLQASHDERPADLLNVPSTTIPPHLFFQHRSIAMVRRGIQVDSATPDNFDHAPHTSQPTRSLGGFDSSREPSLSSWQAFSRADTEIPEVSEDPRLLRPLPWKPADLEVRRMSRFVAWCAYYGFTLAVVPVMCVRLTLRGRQFSLRSMLTWPLAVAIIVMSVMIDGPDGDFQTLPRKLMIAYFAAGPVLFTFIVFARWLWLGRWQGIVSWAGIALLATILMMALSIAGTTWQHSQALQPGERYLWDGWYWMAAPVFYLATWALLLSMFVQWLARGCSRFFYPRTQNQSGDRSAY